MIQKEKLLRRELLAAGAVAVSGVGLVALADSRKEGHHHHHEANKSDSKLISDLYNCIQTGEACLAHCMMLVKKKDTSIADCMASVLEMLPVCKATAQLIGSDSAFAKDQAKVCLAVCEDCEKRCRKHAKEHAACKHAAEACGAVIKSLKTFLA